MVRSRYRRILWFFGRTILSIIWWDLVLPRIGLKQLSQKTQPARQQRIAAQFRRLAVEMGGVMIKMGQFLSARLDVLPHVITDELSGLQDEVEPEEFSVLEQVMEGEFRAPIGQQFAAVDPVPMASASIGQVHRAVLANGGSNGSREVVIKIQRPNIQQIVETDLSALRVVSRWINYYPPIRKRADIPALLDEFSRSLHEEIDYLNEGKNAETFAANFAGSPQVRVPRVYWGTTTRCVLTLEEVQGIKITDYERIEAAGISRAEVAERLFNTYLKQIFEDCYFHADPHPGNLFVLPIGELQADGKPEWQLVFVDFGMTGRVDPRQLEALREALIAVGTQNAARLVRAYQMLGVLLPNADLDLLERASQRMFEQFWGKSTTEIVNLGHQEAAALAREFSTLLYEMPFQITENLILLGRCLGILSGICTGLNPDFNAWTSAAPYARRLIEAEGGSRQNVIVREALDFLRVLVSLPGRADSLLRRIEQGQLEVSIPEITGQVKRLEQRLNRLAWSIVFAALLLGSIQLYLAGEEALAAAGGAAALITLLVLLGS